MARKILLADDSVTAQNMGRRILSDAGYEVITVNNGSAALKKIAEDPPDLLILDVYMPGYGGVEVCQRVKEAPETAHIPVLLTVGKLEPFKADEARRVHADAHLVKPFEASELLMALTKLEDKIVPRAEPRPALGSGSMAAKSGERGNAKAANQPVPSKDKGKKDTKFGDSASEWKDRLKIHAPAQPEEVEAGPETAEVAKVVKSGFRSLERTPVNVAERAASNAVRHGMVGDITADEIAAIAAAAAAYSAKTDFAEAAPEAEGTQEMPPAALPDAVAGLQGGLEVEPQAQGDVNAMEEAPPAPTSDAIAIPAPAMEYEPASADVDSLSASSAAAEVPCEQKIADAEVVAALASLIPVNGNAGVGFANLEPHFDSALDSHGESSPSQESRSERGFLAGPRWTAQEVPLGEADAACILEREMEKAYAALRQSGLAGAEEMSAAPEANEPAAAENHASSAYPDYAPAHVEFASAIAEVSFAGEAPLVASAFRQTPETGSAELAAETRAMEDAFEADASATQPQTWADMAWADTPARPSRFVAEDPEMAAPVDDEAILAELREVPAERAETAVSDDVAATPETAVLSMEVEPSLSEANSETAAPVEVAATAASETADAETPIYEPEPPSEISEAASESFSAASAGSALGEWRLPQEPSGDVAAVGMTYEVSAGQSDSGTQLGPPAIIESIAAVVEEAIAAENQPESAFAAAASAGYGFRTITHDEPNPQTAEPEQSAASVPAAVPETTGERETELAAAWAHWKQIRETIGSPQLTSQVADAAATELRDVQPEAFGAGRPEAEALPTPASPAEPDSVSSAEIEASSIASIVDSVLADLRPKLVAEIAKKLSKDKKQK